MNNVAPSKDEVNNNAGETKNAEDPEKKNDEDKQKAEEPAIDMDEFIATILSVGTPGCSLTETVKADTIVAFCAIAKESFTRQPFMIEIDGPVKICGDTHGQYSDVLRLLDRGGFPPYSNYLFLGDYVDRGHQSLEVILLFMAFKIKYESNFFILRGNHECPAINRAYGFFEECQRRYDARIWNIFQDTFAQMPYVALVGGRILCMHGGISPLLHSLQQLRDIKERPLDPANPSLLMDLLWADPDPNTKKVPDKPNGFHPNARGVSYTFGCDVVDEYVYKLGVDLIVRAHQVVQDGYEFMANKKLVTIFSAPHYCGQFSNFAAMMVVDANNVCSFHILQPKEKDKPTKVAKK